MGKIKKLRERYVNYLGEYLFKEIISLDQTPTKKYAEYLLLTTTEMIKKEMITKIDGIFVQFINDVKDYNELIDYIPNKDIYHKDYRNPNYLHDVVDIARNKREKKLLLNAKKRNDVFVLLETDSFILLEPLTRETANFYGMNTKWCTTGNKTYFDSSYKGRLLYLLSKSDVIKEDGKKIGMSDVNSGSKKYTCYNQQDHSLSSIFELSKYDWLMDDINLINKVAEKYFTRNRWYYKSIFFKNSFYNIRKQYLQRNGFRIT